MQDYFWESGVMLGYQKSDYVALGKLQKDVLASNEANIYTLWNLKKRDPQSHIYHDDEISE